MKASLNFIREVEEEVIRDVHAGEISRTVLSNMAEKAGFGPTAGENAHRLIRAFGEVDPVIGFFKYGHAFSGKIGVDVDADINHITASIYYPTGRPAESVQDLLERREVDTEGFEVSMQEHNEWTVSSRQEEGWEQVRNKQTDVRLTRKTREPEFPEPQLVEVTAPPVEPPDVELGDEPCPEGWRTALVLTDTHHSFRRDEKTGDLIPTHDRHSIDLVKQVASLADIDEVDHLGDGIDCPEISDYDTPPDIRRTLQPSLIEFSYDLEQIRKAARPDTTRLFEGNHEVRLQDSIVDQAPALYGIKDVEAVREGLPPQLSFRSLLRLDKKGIEWVGDYPDEEVRLNEGLSLAHDWGSLGSKSGHTVYKMLRDQKGEISRVQGHGHRHEKAWFTNWEGQNAKEYFGLMLGCLSRLDGVVEGVKKRQNWQQSFALLHYDPNGWEHTIEDIKVHAARRGGAHRECYFRGQRLRSREPNLEELTEQTDWRFTRHA